MKKSKYALFLSLTCFGLYAQNIHRTACQGNLVRLDSMLSTTSIDIQDYRGRSLLHWAVACKQDSVLHFLVQKGIALNNEDHQNKTPMHMAVRFGNEMYFDLLRGLQPTNDWTETYGPSFLETAVLKRDSAMLKKLISSGIDVNGKNERGSSALEISQRIKATEISKFLLANGADKNAVRTIAMRGAYMGQPEPQRIPKMFAPNFISTEEYEFGSVFNSDATEFFYGVDVNGKSEIRYSKLTNGNWSQPITILSHSSYGYNDPFLSPDDNRMYFISNRAIDGEGEPKEDIDIWFVERTSDGWSEPVNAGSNINSSGEEYYISFTNTGTMYFSSNTNASGEAGNSDQDIYYSKFVDGEFQKAVRLGDAINTPDYEADVFVDPEEKYLIFCAMRPDALGRGDLYISFKNANGTWSKSKNMGHVINTKNHELCPYVTSDGQFLFYTSNEDIYWVSTETLDDLKPKDTK